MGMASTGQSEAQYQRIQQCWDKQAFKRGGIGLFSSWDCSPEPFRARTRGEATTVFGPYHPHISRFLAPTEGVYMDERYLYFGTIGGKLPRVLLGVLVIGGALGELITIAFALLLEHFEIMAIGFALMLAAAFGVFGYYKIGNRRGGVLFERETGKVYIPDRRGKGQMALDFNEQIFVEEIRRANCADCGRTAATTHSLVLYLPEVVYSDGTSRRKVIFKLCGRTERLDKYRVEHMSFVWDFIVHFMDRSRAFDRKQQAIFAYYEADRRKWGYGVEGIDFQPVAP